MLLIEGWLKLPKGAFDTVIAAAQDMVGKTLAEEGCLHYSFARDIFEPDLIRVSERWRDEAALGAHMASAHMAAFNQVMGSIKPEGADLRLYTASEQKKLM